MLLLRWQILVLQSQRGRPPESWNLRRGTQRHSPKVHGAGGSKCGGYSSGGDGTQTGYITCRARCKKKIRVPLLKIKNFKIAKKALNRTRSLLCARPCTNEQVLSPQSWPKLSHWRKWGYLLGANTMEDGLSRSLEPQPTLYWKWRNKRRIIWLFPSLPFFHSPMSTSYWPSLTDVGE